MKVELRLLRNDDPPVISAAFAAIGWSKTEAQYERYLAEQLAGERDVLVATVDGTFAGYGTVKWHPEYEPFLNSQIPEIQDLNVLPHWRRKRIASTLLDEAEARIARRSAVAGIGVGLDPDYGAAQRLYVLRGYVPDGRGIASRQRHVHWGDTVRVDDDLVLYLTKQVRERTNEVPPSAGMAHA